MMLHLSVFRRLSVFLALLVPALAATAQTPVFKIEDDGGTPLLLVNDDGTITLPQGATNGYVLTTDANGNAAWQPASAGTVVTNATLTGEGTASRPLGLADDGVTGPTIHPDAIQGGSNVTVTRDGSDNVVISASGGGSGGLSLPFAGSVADPGTAFRVENTGTGSAGQFSAANAAGLVASSTNSVGASITAPSGDAVNIQAAGSPSATNSSTSNNGIEVQGAQGSGLYVGQGDEAGVFIESAFYGVRVENSNQSALRVGNAFTHGLHVLQAQTGSGLFVDQSGSHGMAVVTAGTDGVFVGTAADDGMHVTTAGTPSTSVPDPAGGKNGFEVEGAEGHGLYVGQADNDGVHIGGVGSPSDQQADDFLLNGVEVEGAEGHGFYVGRADEDGLRVASAGGAGLGAFDTGRGVYVQNASINGLQVQSTQGNGLHVVDADLDGVLVGAAARHAGNFNNSQNGGQNTATVFAENTGTGDAIAGWFTTHGSSAAVVASHQGSGPIFSGFAGGDLKFRVQNNGNLFLDGTIGCTDCIDGSDVSNGSLTGSDIANGSLTGSDLQDGSVNVIKLENPAGGEYNSSSIFVGDLPRLEYTIVRDVTIDAPSPGLILTWASVNASTGDIGPSFLRCEATENTTIDNSLLASLLVLGLDQGQAFGTLSFTRPFVVSQAGPFTINLVCLETGDDVDVDRSEFTAIFVPNQY